MHNINFFLHLKCIYLVCRWISNWKDSGCVGNHDSCNIYGSKGWPSTCGWLPDLLGSLVGPIFA